VLGEGEILRQVRRADEVARAERASGPVLGGLFRHAVMAGKRARAETGIARGVTSLSHVAVQLAERRSGDLAGRRVAVLGAGEMGAGIVDALGNTAGNPSIVILNRSSGRGRELAARVGARALPLGALPRELETADVIIAASTAGEVVLGAEQVAAALPAREGRPLVVVDVAVPRNVDPLVAELPAVELYDLDDLRRVAEEEMAARRSEIRRVRAVLAEELERYRTSVLGRSVAPLVSALRARAEEVRLAELQRNAALLASLTPEQAEAVQMMTRRLVAKLVHEPSAQVKQAAGSPRGERLAEALRQLFAL
jgi:glutamyl-tRNA reductase